MKRRVLSSLAALAIALAGTSLSADVVRESTGQRRVELDKMELQTFPADAWGKLAGWTGDALTASVIKDKPVLIVSWASWHQGSLKALALAQKMADKFGGQGLIVVGVHHQQGWAEAAEAAKSRGAKFLMAHDASNAFRQALKIDHEPAFYFIDRAGHLRYAAVASQSVEEACAELAGETAAQAGDIPTILKKRNDDAAANLRKTSEIRPDVELQKLPPVPPGYSQPPEAAYKASDWPKIDDQQAKEWGLVDQAGKRLEPRFAFNPAGYFPAKPEQQGRATVVYLWHPDIIETYKQVMPDMDLLQQRNNRDVAVIGALIPVGRLDSQRNNNDPNAAESPEKLQRKYQSFITSRNFNHTLAADLNATALASLGGQGGSSKFPIPGAMVVSSDGVIRWIGPIYSPAFKYAVDTVLANDPGVQMRRVADRAYIENKGK